ncbi:hypothetical protein STEG23_018373, partial [Scotinomys teguina]
DAEVNLALNSSSKNTNWGSYDSHLSSPIVLGRCGALGRRSLQNDESLRICVSSALYFLSLGKGKTRSGHGAQIEYDRTPLRLHLQTNHWCPNELSAQGASGERLGANACLLMWDSCWVIVCNHRSSEQVLSLFFGSLGRWSDSRPMKRGLTEPWASQGTAHLLLVITITTQYLGKQETGAPGSHASLQLSS